MRRALCIVFCAFVSMTAWARSAFEITLDGGYAMLIHYPDFTDGTGKGSYGLGAHIGYTYYPTRYFGFGIGLDTHRYGGLLARPYSETLYGVYDSNGEIHDLTHDYTSWNRHVQLWYFEPNISLQFPVPFANRFGLLFAVGVKYQVGISGSTATDWTVTHLGYYPKWHMTITDVPEYGFGTEKGNIPTEKIPAPNQVAMFFRADALIPIATGWQFVAGINAQYGLTNYQPLSVNFELGFRVAFSVGRHERCLCEKDD